MFSDALLAAATNVLENCRAKQLTLATAESCTGGLLSALLTEIPGASDVVLCGLTTYSNHAKLHVLGVDESTLSSYGAVSAEVAVAMANGARNVVLSDLAVAITGIAGPDGGTPEKPVGLVYIAVRRAGMEAICQKCFFKGSRSEIRLSTVQQAIAMLLDIL